MIEIQDPFDKASKLYSHIIEAFEEQKVNPTPLNYYIWYQYFKGDNPQFRQEMDDILKDPYGYHDRAGRRLFHTYFSEMESQDTTGFDKALKRLLEVMAKRMQAWTDKLEQQTSHLENYTRELDQDIDHEEVKRISQQVLDTANSMQESSLAFSSEITESTDEIQKLRQQLIDAKAEAMQDELTQIGNRKAFNQALEEYTDLVNNQELEEGNVYMILSDIDHFKQFNDTYGHLIGDSILRYFANMIKRNQIEGQETCRYGGEEFAILLKGVDYDTALSIAEKNRKDIESAHLKRKDSSEPLRTITASFGIACYQANEDPEVFVHRADDALYLAKKSGRNRVISEKDLTDEQPLG